MPISKHSTLVEMKDYIRKHPQIKIKLGQKKSLLLAALDKEGHIHTGPRGSSAPTKGASPKKATPKKAGGNTVAGQLLDLDMDVGKKIGEAVKQRKFTLKMKYSYGKAIGKKRAKKDLERGNDYQDFAAMGEGETDWEIIKKEREGFTAGYKEVWGKRTPKKTTIKSRWKKVFKSELDGAVTNSSRWSNMSDKYIRVVVNRIRKGEKIKDVLDNIASMIRHGEIHNSEW